MAAARWREDELIQPRRPELQSGPPGSGLSRIADIVPDDLNQPSGHDPPSLEPLELIIHDILTLSGS